MLNPAVHEPDAYVGDRPVWGAVHEKYGIAGSFGLPRAVYVSAKSIPYERREAARVNAKMASLNANTTGASTEEASRFSDDRFMGNAIADAVAASLMADFPELHRKMDFPLGEYDPRTNKFEKQFDAARKVTGRSIFLSLKDQDELYKVMGDRFDELVVQKEALGESPLEQAVLPLESRTKGRMELAPASGTSLFGGATWVEQVDIKALRKPYTPDAIAQTILSNTLDVDGNPVDTEWLSQGDGLGELENAYSELRSSAVAYSDQLHQQLSDQVEEMLDQQARQLGDLRAQLSEYKEIEAQRNTVNSELRNIKTRLNDIDESLAKIKLFEKKGVDGFPDAGVDELAQLHDLVLEKDALVTEKDGLEPRKPELALQIQEYRAEMKAYGNINGKVKTAGERLEDIKRRWQRVSPIFQEMKLGQPVQLGDEDGGVMYGIVTGVERVNAVKNPLVGGAWRYRVAVVDSAQEVTLRIGDVRGFYTDKEGTGVSAIESGKFYNPPTFDEMSIPRMFEVAQTVLYERREIITGNTLQADIDLVRRGKTIAFTTASGLVRQGILMKRGFDTQKELESRHVPIADIETRVEFLNKSIRQDRKTIQAKLTSSDNVLMVKRHVRHNRNLGLGDQKESGYQVQLKKGALAKRLLSLESFTDSFRDIEGNPQMKKKKSTFIGFVPEEKIEQFMGHFSSLLVTQSEFKEWARNTTGQTLQDMMELSEDVAFEMEALEMQVSTEGIQRRVDQVNRQQEALAEAQIEKQRQRLELREQVEAEALRTQVIQALGKTKSELEPTPEDVDAFLEQMVENPNALDDYLEAQHEQQILGDSVSEGGGIPANIPSLIEGYRAHFVAGEGFSSIVQARQFAATFLSRTGFEGELTDKTLDEAIESAIVLASRDIVASVEQDGGDRLMAYDRLVDLYGNQPRLSSQTSHSVLNQQYSTPVPLGILVQQLANVQDGDLVYEPTVGNGSLVSGVNPEYVMANELDSRRAETARSQGYEVTEQDATEYKPAIPVDVVVANPPFGKSKDKVGQDKVFTVDLNGSPAGKTQEYQTTAVDHAIAFKSLAAMKEDGRAVLILGAPMAQKIEGRDALKTYRGKDKRAFFYTLYENYNVTDHFTVTGDLYAKQGTSFPVDVVVIDGRGKSELIPPYVQAPPTYDSWDQLRGVMAQTMEQQQVVAANRSTIDSLNAMLSASPAVSPVKKSLLQDAQERIALLSVDRFAVEAGITEDSAQRILNFIEWDVVRKLDTSPTMDTANAIAERHGFMTGLSRRKHRVSWNSYEECLADTLSNLSGQTVLASEVEQGGSQVFIRLRLIHLIYQRLSVICIRRKTGAKFILK